MSQILQNKKSKLIVILFMILFLSLWTMSVFAGEKFCPYCGEETPPDARFCSYCGQELAGEKLPKIRHYGIGFGYGFDILADDSGSLALYLDYVSDSGLGCQLNMAFYTSYSESADSVFIFPMIMKYQLQKASGVSPYFGIGLSYGRCEYYDWSSYPYEFEEWDGIVPVFCGGITFFSNSPVEVSWDGKYFLNPDYFKASTFFLSALVSLNW